jgi:NAD(P)H-hydrate epimerase
VLDFRDWAKEPISTLEMMIIDRNAEYFGIPRRLLMESAGRAVATLVVQRQPGARRILVVAGLGDNGGDGVVAARYLHSWGREVTVILLGRASESRSALLSENLGLIRNMGIRVIEAPSPLDLLSHQGLFHQCEVIVDAIMGTGVRGALREPQATAVELINMSSAFRVAVDVPSGLDPDTGEVMDNAVRAHVTVTMHRAKRASWLATPGPMWVNYSLLT